MVAVVPGNGTTGVPFNQAVTATFSEALDPTTINNTTFTLTSPGGGSVAGLVTYVVTGSIATFTPSADLAPLTTYMATITTGTRDLAGNALVSNYVWSFTTGAAPDTTPPTVVAVVPGNGTTRVPFNQAVTATFSEALDPTTINNTTFTLTAPGGGSVAGLVTYVVAGSVATFAPLANLAPLTAYVATVSTGARDLAGNALVSNYVWSFTTGAAPDTTPPTVVAVVPGNGTTGVPFNQAVTATFSEALDPTTISSTTFTITGAGASPVAGLVTYVVAGSVATFTPSADLAPLTTYVATITTGTRDLAGNALVSNYVWSFTTGAAPDTTPPTVVAVVPVNGATGVPFNQAIAATFSEALDPTTISSTTFTITGAGASPVAGLVTYVVAGSVATFTPSADLAPLSTYVATITTGTRDLAGNALVSNYVWSFTTGAAPDTTPPTVIAAAPANGATGVPFNQAITATFSEAMDPTTLNNTSFTLTGAGASSVTGLVTYGAIANTATLTPSAPLAPLTTYVATITNAATDLAGNGLGAGAVSNPWSFTTGAAPDTTPPTILSTNPGNTNGNVPISATANSTFSEAIDPLTITTATFYLTGPGATMVSGTVAYDAINFIATFNPSVALGAGVTYVATVTSGVQDLAGNPLVAGAAPNPWNFSTTAAVVPPVVPLGTAALFGGIGGAAGMTNQGTSTVIDGDIGTTGASSVITGFHDSGPGCTYTETTLNIGTVNGAIDTAPPPPSIACSTEGTAATLAIATQAAADASTAYLDLVALPGGLDVATCTGCGGGSAGELGGRTLPPGVYKSTPGSYLLSTGDLILDAQGDANAYWVFQMSTSLTVGTPTAHRSVLLLNGAQAKNVFWQVGTAATINGILGGGTMTGTILAQTAITVSTAGVAAVTTINGRAIVLSGPVTLVNTVIHVPGP